MVLCVLFWWLKGLQILVSLINFFGIKTANKGIFGKRTPFGAHAADAVQNLAAILGQFAESDYLSLSG